MNKRLQFAPTNLKAAGPLTTTSRHSSKADLGVGKWP